MEQALDDDIATLLDEEEASGTAVEDTESVDHNADKKVQKGYGLLKIAVAC